MRSRPPHPIRRIHRPIRIGGRPAAKPTAATTFLVHGLQLELPRKFPLQVRYRRQEEFACRSEGDSGRDFAVGLDLDEESGFHWVGHFVAGEDDVGVGEELSSDHVGHGVILLDDLDRRSIRDLRVLRDFKCPLSIAEDVEFEAVWCVHG